MHLKLDEENVLAPGSYRYILPQATGCQGSETTLPLLQNVQDDHASWRLGMNLDCLSPKDPSVLCRGRNFVFYVISSGRLYPLHVLESRRETQRTKEVAGRVGRKHQS